ncbi:hypothetical protein FKG94_07590 [Exilibacterium tricleocarpae]|uniref:Uncharacterized protein n=1 Tax=Exilibacterium tricleocarpae TaxID=2591008 RepID=A0A545TZE7_9GAMM|nr:hypothetical protein [Exilibacterium tricleocarpae]TQV82586.1 hypothetical protein FKG94_07590 [Exilibacterium tricleocarpae]
MTKSIRQKRWESNSDFLQFLLETNLTHQVNNVTGEDHLKNALIALVDSLISVVASIPFTNQGNDPRESDRDLGIDVLKKLNLWTEPAQAYPIANAQAVTRQEIQAAPQGERIGWMMQQDAVGTRTAIAAFIISTGAEAAIPDWPALEGLIYTNNSEIDILDKANAPIAVKLSEICLLLNHRLMDGFLGNVGAGGLAQLSGQTIDHWQQEIKNEKGKNLPGYVEPVPSGDSYKSYYQRTIKPFDLNLTRKRSRQPDPKQGVPTHRDARFLNERGGYNVWRVLEDSVVGTIQRLYGLADRCDVSGSTLEAKVLGRIVSDPINNGAAKSLVRQGTILGCIMSMVNTGHHSLTETAVSISLDYRDKAFDVLSAASFIRLLGDHNQTEFYYANGRFNEFTAEWQALSSRWLTLLLDKEDSVENRLRMIDRFNSWNVLNYDTYHQILSASKRWKQRVFYNTEDFSNAL